MSFTVLEDLWFGLTSDGAQTEEQVERKAEKSLAAQVARVHGLLRFPVTARRLVSLLRDPEFSVVQVAQLIKEDPSLATRILQTVNSPGFGLRRKCTSIEHAIVLLGGGQLSQIATAVAMLGMYGKSGPEELLRRHSAEVATLARRLALYCRASPEAFTCGLLHDLGKMMMLQVEDLRHAELGENYWDLLAAHGHEFDGIHLYERDVFAYDHAVLAGHMLHYWGIPEPIPQAVAWHHQPGRFHRADHVTGILASVVRLADRISYGIGRRGIVSEQLAEECALDGAADFLGFSARDLSKVWGELEQVVMEGRRMVA